MEKLMIRVILIFIFTLFAACSEQKDENNVDRHAISDSSQETISINSITFRCDYLGEIAPGNDPKIFSPNVISTGDLHSSVYFSPEGTEVYYTRLFSNGNKSGVLCRKKENNKWSEPRVIPNTEEALTPFISIDGKRLFCSLGYDLYVMTKHNDKWGSPVSLGQKINFQKRQDGIYESSKGTIFYTAMFGKSDGIYSAEFKNGKYQSPVKLDLGLYDQTTTGYSYISPDESYLIFQSRIEGGIGASDLYIMFKTDNDSWTKPINMGNKINTKDSESFPNVSPDGKYLFFNSNRISEVNSKVPGHFYGNIYWVKTDIIYKLKK